MRQADTERLVAAPYGVQRRLARSVGSHLGAMGLSRMAKALTIAVSAWVVRMPRSQLCVVERVHAGVWDIKRETVPLNLREFLVYRPDREGD